MKKQATKFRNQQGGLLFVEVAIWMVPFAIVLLLFWTVSWMLPIREQMMAFEQLVVHTPHVTQDEVHHIQKKFTQNIRRQHKNVISSLEMNERVIEEIMTNSEVCALQMDWEIHVFSGIFPIQGQWIVPVVCIVEGENGD